MSTKPPTKDYAVLLFRGRGFFSWLIRLQTRGHYAHAAILCPDGTILESFPFKGVRRHVLKDWEGIDAFTVRDMDLNSWSRVESAASKEVGAGYDYVGVIRFVTRRTHAGDKRRFCSEYVFHHIKESGGIDLLRDTKAWEVSPALLARSPLLEKFSG